MTQYHSVDSLHRHHGVEQLLNIIYLTLDALCNVHIMQTILQYGGHYCKSGNFRATFIFALFTLQPGCEKIKAREYVHFVLRSM